MTTLFLKSTISALALGAMTTVALAQDTLTGTRALNDRLDDVEDVVQDDLDRANDAARFANPEYRPGLSGSASLAYSGKTGNNESQDLSIGARLRHAQGPFVQSLGVVVDFQEANNSATKEDVFAVYEAAYYFNNSFYGFVLGRVQTDGLATAAADIKRDAFLGFGPGYRVVNRPDMTWRVQAGVGVSYLQNGVEDSETEVGYIASSRFFYQFNPNVFLTNDTDILNSDTALRVNNDFGVNFRMTDSFSTRVSYLSEYNDSRAIRTDNKLGVSLVYGF
ncbi:DUF481 domain-containing protein [Szabonella alba]|uniref:DUF481 domain-containing protein n=1 Tax=Szabonella alba TaxID=2804194 RepID=A0A8K0V999_9RHOB|nr:DUF481 domain-containing protein [Szabonella alba]MBL4917708.1 DUF481 domain-containing protein [Szabonella alba]